MATAHVIPFRPRRPLIARCIDLAEYRNEAGPREPLSPFEHLMRPRELTPREILHRRRMLEQFARGGQGGEARSIRIVRPQ